VFVASDGVAVTARQILGTGSGILLLGCSGLIGPDPAEIVALEQALAEAEPASAADLFIQGSVEAGSVRFGCAKAFGALPSDPQQRAAIIAEAFGDWTTLCPGPCVDDAPALLHLEPPDQIATALAQCDASGPDAVFGGPLAGLRPSMPPMDYLAVRELTELADEASPTFASLHPKLAVSLVLKDTPAMAPGADLMVQSSRAVDADALTELQSAIRACGPQAVVSHRVVLDPEGRVAGIAASPPSEPGEPGEPCVVEALQALTLPADGEYAVLDLAWKPEPIEPGGSSGPRRPVVDGPLALSVVEGVIRAHMGQIRYCYEKQLVRSPSLTGDVVVRFGIAPSGAVSEAETISSTFRSPAFARCIETAFEKWEFPRVPGTVTVTWPIHFAPG
jgi:TonB family protein